MILKGDNIHFSYPGEELFKGFDFEIDEGESVVFHGDSGSGKSTLFRLILGFETPDKGTITYRGKALTGEHLKEFRKNTAWLPQDLNLGEGTVKEVMNFPFSFHNCRNGAPDQTTQIEVLKDLGLDRDLFDKEYSDLSTGQRQRVGIAICHLLNRPVILLDEPTSALDESSKKRVMDLVRGDGSRTILSTSHDSWWTERCDRIIDLETNIQD